MKSAPAKAKPAKKQHFSQEYLDYMKSQAWREKRAQRLKLDGFECQTCKAKASLQVHHKTYENCNKLGFGSEPLEDLITLCEGCHKAVTAAIRRSRKRRK